MELWGIAEEKTQLWVLLEGRGLSKGDAQFQDTFQGRQAPSHNLQSQGCWISTHPTWLQDAKDAAQRCPSLLSEPLESPNQSCSFPWRSQVPQSNISAPVTLHPEAELMDPVVFHEAPG